MMIQLLRLELRKNVLAGASLALAFLVCLPAARFVAASSGLAPLRALHALLIGWVFPGLPLAAAMLGAVAGAGVVSSRETEALLPVSGRARAAAALGAALLLTLVLSAVVLGVGRLVGLSWTASPNLARYVWFDVPIGPALVLAAAQALTTAFVLAYALGHAPAGGIIGALIAVPTLGAVIAGMFLDRILENEGFSTTLWFIFAAAALMPGMILALGSLLERGERDVRLGAFAWSRVALGLAAVPLVLLFGYGAIEAQFKKNLHLAYVIGTPPPASSDGALATALDGGVYWLTPTGSFEIVPPVPSDGVGRMNPYAAYLLDSAWHGDTLWILRATLEGPNQGVELWTGTPSGELRRVKDVPSGSFKLVLWKGGVATAESGSKSKTVRVCSVQSPHDCAEIFPAKLQSLQRSRPTTASRRPDGQNWPKSPQRQILRTEGGRRWLISDGRLEIVAEGGGPVLKTVELPTKDSWFAISARDGFYVEARGSLYHYDWEGRGRRVRRSATRAGARN